MSEKRREYPVNLIINGQKISAVIIDPHYEEKHSAVINDDLILKLVELLEFEYHDFENERSPFKYHASTVKFESKFYRLIWLLEKDQFDIGIRNAYRSSK